MVEIRERPQQVNHYRSGDGTAGLDMEEMRESKDSELNTCFAALFAAPAGLAHGVPKNVHWSWSLGKQEDWETWLEEKICVICGRWKQRIVPGCHLWSETEMGGGETGDLIWMYGGKGMIYFLPCSGPLQITLFTLVLSSMLKDAVR